MPSQPAIPPPLSNQFPFLPPAGSLTLITSVLGASANWIVQRHILAALKPQPLASVKEGADVKIMLISWLRGSELWGEALKKLVSWDKTRVPNVALPSLFEALWRFHLACFYVLLFRIVMNEVSALLNSSLTNHRVSALLPMKGLHSSTHCN